MYRCSLLRGNPPSGFDSSRTPTLGNPTGHHLNHFQGQFGTGAILLGGGLPGLLALQLSAFARRALVGLALAAHADQDGEGQYLLGAKGKATCKEKTTKLWPKAKEGPF